jgi:hypothetical protein
MYGSNLLRYVSRFPRENIKVLIYEEMKRDLRRTLRELYAFLGVNPVFTPEHVLSARINPTAGMRLRPLLSLVNETKRALIAAGLGWVWDHPARKTFAGIVSRLNHAELSETPEVSDAVRDWLRKHYREDRVVLEELLERDLSPFWGPR